MGQFISKLTCLCNSELTAVKYLSNAMEVGIGLYLALAIVQVVGSVGVARLQRKATRVREVILTSKINSAKAQIANVEAELLRLELGLEALSTRFFNLCVTLILISIGGIVWTSIYPSALLNNCQFYLILLFYLALAPVLFAITTVVIKVKSSRAAKRLADCEDQVLKRILEE